jgi:hypothetical protein
MTISEKDRDILIKHRIEKAHEAIEEAELSINHQKASLLLRDIRELIENTRQKFAVTVNAGLSILYRQIGELILKDILNDKRAAYGKKILPTLSAKLVPQYGNGFSTRNLARMIRFAEVFKDVDSQAKTNYC